MKKNTVLLLGSGGLKIGQAGEFDYSGSQAIKAFREEGMRVILVNPNIATVQTDFEMADEIYFQPLNLSTLERIIQKEKPQSIALSFGGQTALNIGLELEETGLLNRYGIRVLGTCVESIRQTENREIFKQKLELAGFLTPQSRVMKSVEEALEQGRHMQYPLMLRSGFSLGGLGSGKIHNEQELIESAKLALNQSPQILLEEYLLGWKEIEVEVVRDKKGQALAICTMENLDPMGIHTGESIVIAPCQTLTNSEFQTIRSMALNIAHLFSIEGECNVQFALKPHGNLRVIEMNARLSRSSALASKATGYPLAFVAAKIALGYTLEKIPNAITKTTSSFFEPALDYVVIKIPRWDTKKLKHAERTIGSEMKSVGEVMAIGRSFGEAIQKGVRMLNIGSTGLDHPPCDLKNPLEEIVRPTDHRLFALYQFLKAGHLPEEIHQLSHIDLWFLNHIKALVELEVRLCKEKLFPQLLREAKRHGFSDSSIARHQNTSEERIREKRIEWEITPFVKQIDTLAGECKVETNYLYMTYWGQEHDVFSSKQAIAILGSGPYCIGSSVEFDWCAVNACRTLRKELVETILINSNPETVSTDFDESDRLYFEELTLERVRDIYDFESPRGILISFSGQIANNLALSLSKYHLPILGTSSDSIDCAENREKFSSLLTSLDISQPPWHAATSIKTAHTFATAQGYPLLVRPSYVLSGAAMSVVHTSQGLEECLKNAQIVSPDHPVVLSKFIEEAKEIEIDGVAKEGAIVIQAISEHVEHAGVHSGDATLVLPPQYLYLETIRKAKQLSAKIVQALHLTGPFNIQFIAKGHLLQVIECNVRASRSFPFVSKVTGQNFVQIATQILIGKPVPVFHEPIPPDYVGVKTPQFSYQRLKGADPVARVEMASTGEVAAFGKYFLEALYTSWISTDQTVRKKRLLASINEEQKEELFPLFQHLAEKGWSLYATPGTHNFFSQRGIISSSAYKIGEFRVPNVRELIAKKKIDLVINIPANASTSFTEGFKIRRLATDHAIPLITNVQLASAFLRCLIELDLTHIPIQSWREIVRSKID